jgi:serine/threonine protein phosphatase PrpC
MKNKLTLSIGEYTNKGAKEINQDFHDINLSTEPQLTQKGIAIAMADGISSSNVSQDASKIAVTSFLTDYFSTPDTWSVKKSVERVLNATNSWLYAQSKQGQYYYDEARDRGYVCTFSAMVLRSTTAYIFHAGDTRIYRLRDERLEQLTEDHRLWISKETSYLSRALGMDTQFKMDYSSFPLEKEDVFFFMTDGVYEFVNDKAIVQIFKEQGEDFSVVAKKLASKAYENGSTDNLTVQLIRVDDLPNKEVDEIHQRLDEKPFPPILDARMEFDGYTIIRELSGSNRSHVYLAVDNETDTKVVIKTPSIDLQEDKIYIERFLMEEWIAIRLNNPHVAKSYLQTRKRNYVYNVSEYIEGQTLTQWMIDNPHPSIETVRGITEQIAKGLQAFHSQEMIHQDLRPANVMIDKTGTVKIIDFGATRVAGIREVNNHLDQGDILGTAQYSAPEYFLGKEATQSSDLFSLAVMVYQMFAEGKLPYGVEVPKTRTKAAQKKLKYDSIYTEENQFPIWIEEALKKALAPDPGERYEVVTEFIFDLRHPNQAFLNKKRPPFLERNPVLLWKGISFVLALIIVAILNR